MRILATAALGAGVLSAVAPAGDDPKIVATTLSAIRQTPESFKGVWVTFAVQFGAIGRLQNPFFTEFVASEFANFHAWADEQPIWRKADYDDLFGTLFLSKEHPELDALFHIEPYERLQLTGWVRSTFQGQPWIEVKSFARIDGKVNTATLAHLFRGEEHMKRRQWAQAISELSLAPAAGVPGHVRAAVHRNLGLCHLRLGEPTQALAQLQTAQSLAGNDRETTQLIETARSAPQQALDRQVRQPIRDSVRPLWEAFEEDGLAAPPLLLDGGVPQPQPQAPVPQPVK